MIKLNEKYLERNLFKKGLEIFNYDIDIVRVNNDPEQLKIAQAIAVVQALLREHMHECNACIKKTQAMQKTIDYMQKFVIVDEGEQTDSPEG